MKRQGKLGMAHARAWYHSPKYAEALTIRARALDRKLIFVEGVPPASEEE